MPFKILLLLATASLSLSAYEIEGKFDIIGWTSDGIVAEANERVVLMTEGEPKEVSIKDLRQSTEGILMRPDKITWHQGASAEFKIDRARSLAGSKLGVALIDPQNTCMTWLPSEKMSEPIQVKISAAAVSVFNSIGQNAILVNSNGAIFEVPISTGSPIPMPKWKRRDAEVTAALILGDEVVLGTDGGRIILGDYKSDPGSELAIADASTVDFIIPAGVGYFCFTSPGLKIDSSSPHPKIIKGSDRQMVHVEKINDVWTVSDRRTIEKTAYPTGVFQYESTYFVVTSRNVTSYTRTAK